MHEFLLTPDKEEPIVVRIGNPCEREINEEAAQVARALEADISLG